MSGGCGGWGLGAVGVGALITILLLSNKIADAFTRARGYGSGDDVSRRTIETNGFGSTCTPYVTMLGSYPALQCCAFASTRGVLINFLDRVGSEGSTSCGGCFSRLVSMCSLEVGCVPRFVNGKVGNIPDITSTLNTGTISCLRFTPTPSLGATCG